MGQMRKVSKVFIGKSERREPLGRPRHRWEDNIEMDLMKIGWEGVDWIHLTEIGISGELL
jgi:hypothetical protein